MTLYACTDQSGTILQASWVPFLHIYPSKRLAEVFGPQGTRVVEVEISIIE